MPDRQSQSYIVSECRELERLRCGVSAILPDSVAYMLIGQDNYWLSAEQALELGLVDKIC